MTVGLVIVGLVVGAVLGDGDPLGLVGGGLFGALWAKVGALRKELQGLRAQVDALKARMPLRPEAAAQLDAVRAALSGEPEATTAPAANTARPPDAAAGEHHADLPPATPPVPPAVTAADAVAGSVTEPAAVARTGSRSESRSEAATPASARSPADPAPPPVDPWRGEAASATPNVRAPADDSLGRGIRAIVGWFTDGNVPVKVGMVVMFFGVAALLRYASEQDIFSVPIGVRLALIGGAALGALWFAWGKREAQRTFSLSLQGGALGVLLLTVFAAFGLYRLLPAGAAFAMVLLLVAASGLLAVLQNAMALAVLGMTGGFLAPVLISTGSGNHVALFSYYAVLNLAVFGVAWVRPWRVLNLLGFGFTFVVSSLWAWKYYTPDRYATTQPFLVLFFLFYVAIGLLHARRPEHAPRKVVDGTLLFGTPLIAAGLQAGLLEGRPMAMACAALLVAALYMVLAYATWGRERLASLSLGYASLAVGFATAAVPLALDADVTAQVWAVEGAALLWLGLRQQSRLQRMAALALQLIAGFAWLFALDRQDLMTVAAPAWRNGVFIGGIVLALSLWTASRLLERAGSRSTSIIWFVLAGLAWAGAWLHEIGMQLPGPDYRAPWAAWLALCLVLAAELRQRLDWERLGLVVPAALAAGTLLAFTYFGDPPSKGDGAWAWPAWLAAAAFALWRLRAPWTRGLAWSHVVALAGLALLAGNEAYARVGRALGQGDVVWPWLAALAPLAVLFAAALREPPRLLWPLAGSFHAYRLRWLLPAGTVLGIAWLNSLLHHGAADPLPFVPLFNPLELAQLAVLLLATRMVSLIPGADPLLRFGLPAAAGFAALTAATLRAVHHLGGVPWNASLVGTMLAQTSLTVVWSIVGVGAWVLGSRRGSYPLWLAGAVLMGVVLAKLVLVDRQHMGNIPGIVSFLAVGVLLTIVGYFAPSPPRAAREPDA